MRAARRGRCRRLVLDSIAAAFCGPWLRAARAAVPLVAMLHQPPGGIDYGPLRTAFQAALDRLAYRARERLLVASESLAEELRPQVPAPSGSASCHPAVTSPSPRWPAPGDLRHGRRARFLCVGNWVERKGILSLLEAFADPRRRRRDAAPGRRHACPRRRTRGGCARGWRSRTCSDRVVVHGPLSLGEVAALYAAADAFVLPSLKEPYGTVYGEAMAFGLPVVGWRAGNLPYLADTRARGPARRAWRPGGPGRCAAAARRRRRACAPVLAPPHGSGRCSRPTWDEVARLFFDHLREVAEAHARSPL